MVKKLNSQQDDELLALGKDQYLGYNLKVIPTSIMTVYIDEDVKEPSYYRQVVSGIEELSQGDELVFKIASSGGRMDGLEVILSTIEVTEATTIAHIQGECHSAASILALNCDMISVSPYASMLVHFVRYGAQGASNHVLKHAEHAKKISESLFRNTYKYFLTEEEITRCVEDDYQIWLDSSQIQERLERRIELLEQEYQESEEEEDCENCSGESCKSYEGCTANIDASQFPELIEKYKTS